VLIIGVDTHKHRNVAAAVAATGRPVAHRQGDTTPAGRQALLTWAQPLGAARQWGIEGAGSDGHGLARRLALAGETAAEISPRWTATGRRQARRRDKRDGRDAEAVARAVLREERPATPLRVDDETAVLALLWWPSATRRRPRPPGGATGSTSCSVSWSRGSSGACRR
jgi:transposase